MCLSCHNPHDSENTKLLADAGNKLCFSCHPDKGEKTSVSHAAVTTGKGCLTCHAPHAAKNQKMLLAKGGELCFSCHEKTKAAKKSKNAQYAFKRVNVNLLS
jgi:predicted CXXCH cytochrome family protein